MTDTGVRDVCYSLPRIITMGLQCSFCTYFWEMYTGEFGWSMPEYGVVSSIYSFTQIFTFVIFGFIFKFVIDRQGREKQIEAKLKESKYILMAGTSLHWLTYLLLIILPIRWYGVELAFVGLLFRKIKAFLGIICTPFRLLCNCISFPFILFWNLIRIPLIKFGVYYAEEEPPPVNCSPFTDFKNSKVVNISELPSSPINVGGYPDLEASSALELLLPQSQPLSDSIFTDTSLHPMPRVVSAESLSCWRKFCNLITTGRTTGRRYMRPYEKEAAKFPVLLNPGPRSNTLLQRIKTKKLIIYILTIAHGTAVSAHELSNKAILTYMYTDFGKIGEAIGVNLSFFFISNILVIFAFSLVKLNVHSKSKFSDTFVILSIISFIICIPILYCFYRWTKKDTAHKGGFVANINDWKKWVCLVFKWLCLTIWHSTVVFLIFSCGPLINYVAIFIMSGNKLLMSFGVLAFLSSLNGTSWLFMVVTSVAGGFGGDTIQMLVVGVCILCQSAVYLLFNNCNYFMLIVTGIINSLFVTYTNIMLDITYGGNPWKWLFFGGFYAGTNLALAWAMPTMFNAFGQDETRLFVWKCVRFNFQYCFPTIYRLIAIIFQIGSVLSYYIYGIAHRFIKYLDAIAGRQDLLNGLLNKLKAAAGDDEGTKGFKGEAKLFNDTAKQVTTGTQAAKVANFKLAAHYFKLSGLKFKEVSELLYKLSSSVNRSAIAGAAGLFQTQATAFKTQVEAIEDITMNAHGGPVYESIRKLQSASTKFHEAGNAFEAFARAASENCKTLQPHNVAFTTAAEEFAQNAQEFKNEANDFASAAEIFSNADDANHTAFQGAAGAFLKAANAFQTLANELAKNLNGVQELKQHANAFQQAAIEFQQEAEAFNNEAQLVIENTGLDTIKEGFNQAAQAFNDAAEQFGDNSDDKVAGAFSEFAKELPKDAESGNCESQLTDPAQQLKEAANTFQQNAGQFNIKAGLIPTGSLTTKVLKPSKKFKLAAIKFAKAGDHFNAFAKATPEKAKDKAWEFKDKTREFAESAEGFYDLAQLVNKDAQQDQADLNRIKDKFKDAAAAFGATGTGAAHNLQTAINALTVR